MSTHTVRRTPTALLALCVILALVAPPAVHVSARQDEPITWYTYSSMPLQTLDPQVANDTPSVTAIENLFLGLTDIHPYTGEVVPELATSWTVRDDGRVWTFTLRDDVPWVRWDPQTQEAAIIRMVTADDVVYAMQRLCDPRLDTYASVATRIIQGCDDLWGNDPADVVDADYALVQVFALDDTTVEIHLQYAAGYFLNMSALWFFHPVPRDEIQVQGPDWTDIGTLVTNGPFVLDERIDGTRRVFVRNPHIPADVVGPGNVERVWLRELSHEDAFAEFLAGQIDGVNVPAWEVDGMRDDPRLRSYYDNRVYYYGFTYDKPPFDNVHVRRAFGAIVDREQFIKDVVPVAFAEPMIHFTPPGMVGAPPIDEPGVGYDPDYAREQLALAGYPGCVGFPEIWVLVLPNAPDWLTAGDYIAQQAAETLGCDPDLFQIDIKPEPDIINILNPAMPPEDRPHLWTLAWAPDYPDANNWVGDVLRCDQANRMNLFHRTCAPVDDLIFQAAIEDDPLVRNDLYYDIEERFFGPDGEHPMIPLFMPGGYALAQPWMEGPPYDGEFAGIHYDWRTVDQEAQLAARGE